jgi:hypothetical protein
MINSRAEFPKLVNWIDFEAVFYDFLGLVVIFYLPLVTHCLTTCSVRTNTASRYTFSR